MTGRDGASISTKKEADLSEHYLICPSNLITSHLIVVSSTLSFLCSPHLSEDSIDGVV
jgi:hypothetical protein